MKTGASWTCPREREDVRAAILAAAERLVARDGAEAISLSAVAGEAQLAEAVVYGHFSGLKDLLAQLKPEEAETPQSEAAAETPAGAAGLPEKADSSYDGLMRAQAEALDRLAKRVMVPRQPRRDGTEAALTRLETRLGVTEQGLAALEKRLGENLKSLGAESESLAGSLKDIRQRLEKFEERQLEALAGLRLQVHNLSRTEPQAAPPPDAQVVEFPIAMPQPVREETPSHEPAYLASARRAAIDAALAAAAAVAAKPVAHRRRSWKRWSLIGLAAVLVIWFDVYVFAHYQPAEGGTTQAVAMPARRVQPYAPPGPRQQLLRGLKYLNGSGVATDVGKAAVWIGRAAAGGEPVAQNFLGVLYQTGTGVGADMTAAIRWYEEAARRGNLKAMTNLGKLYAGGWREGVDYVKAAGWFGRAAAYGEADAEFDLAILYERGLGVSRNLGEAYKWYAVAGAGGDSHARARAEILAAQLLPAELEAAQRAAASFRPLPADPRANAVPAS